MSVSTDGNTLDGAGTGVPLEFVAVVTGHDPPQSHGGTENEQSLPAAGQVTRSWLSARRADRGGGRRTEIQANRLVNGLGFSVCLPPPPPPMAAGQLLQCDAFCASLLLCASV